MFINKQHDNKKQPNDKETQKPTRGQHSVLNNRRNKKKYIKLF